MLPIPGWAESKPYYGSFHTGNSLLEVCERQNTLNQSICLSYIQGAFDAGLFYDVHRVKSGKICVPRKLQSIQLRDVFLQYLRFHPEERHLFAGVLVIAALKDAFPCSE
tara:strand:+ start:528 stop:854 length:327 start_codon:yes stop_codon:yes gene_type:complete